MSEEKEYFVIAPESLYDSDNLKICIQSKRALNGIGWDNLRSVALNNFDQWFYRSFTDEQADALRILGWKLKEYVAPPCSCGYCDKCWDRHLEEMKVKINDRDEWILDQIGALQDQINELAKNFSKEGEAYWDEMHMIRGATG